METYTTMIIQFQRIKNCHNFNRKCQRHEWENIFNEWAISVHLKLPLPTNWIRGLRLINSKMIFLQKKC